MLRGVLNKNIINRWSNFAIFTSLKCSMHNCHLHNVTDIKRIYHIITTNSSYNDKI